MVEPTVTEGLSGSIEMVVRIGVGGVLVAVTVTIVEVESAPAVAVIVVVPVDEAVKRPAASIEPIARVSLDQVVVVAKSAPN